MEENVQNNSAVEAKMAAIEEFIKERKISGIALAPSRENARVLRTNLLIEGQTLPLFISLDNTVYCFIQIVLADIAAEKRTKCLEYFNGLNNQFSMLKYHITNEGKALVTCSVPSGNDKFDPALVIALIDQIKEVLSANYSALMQTIWMD